MKFVKYDLHGKELYLAFNGEAMFQIRDTFGSGESMIERISGDTKEAFSDLCGAVAILAEQGELARRYMGYEPQIIFKKEAFEKIITPPGIYNLTLLIPRAVAIGFGKEIIAGNGEVDLVLAEINQKKTV